MNFMFLSLTSDFRLPIPSFLFFKFNVCFSFIKDLKFICFLFWDLFGSVRVLILFLFCVYVYMYVCCTVYMPTTLED